MFLVCAFTKQMEAVDLGVLCYEFAAVWWSLFGQLSQETTGPGTVEHKGLKALKRRLAKFDRQQRVLSRLPLKRFSLRPLKVKKN